MARLIDKLAGARARGVPLVGIRTADQPATVREIAQGLNGKVPVISWDSVRGFRPMNKPAQQAVGEIMGGDDMDPMAFGDATTALEAMMASPKGTCVIMSNAQRFLDGGDDGKAPQALLNLRDQFQTGIRTVVLLGPTLSPAPELGQDIYVVEQPMPTSEQRKETIENICKSAGLKDDRAPTQRTIDQAVAYTRGLSDFVVKQSVSLSLSPKGVNLITLRDVWREAIDATPGLRVVTDGGSLDDVAGLSNLKRHAMALCAGKGRPDVVVWVDEIEKALAGGSGAVADSSGSSQAILGAMLREMESAKDEGIILLGGPGTGKSLTAGVLGSSAQVPTIAFVPEETKGSLVGQTEQQIARAMQVKRAIGGRAYWVATCNRIDSLPPELLRRFTDGVWYVDLPDFEERAALIAMYAKIYRLNLATIPNAGDCEGWTGADFRNVFRRAARDGLNAIEVAKDHVPSSRASKRIIDAQRIAAQGTYVSASYPGAYRLPDKGEETETGRTFNLDTEV